MGCYCWLCSALNISRRSQYTRSKGLYEATDREVEVCHVIIIVQYRLQLLQMVSWHHSIRCPQHKAVLRIALTHQLQSGAFYTRSSTERTRLMRWVRVRRDSKEAFTDLTVSSSCLETCTPKQNLSLRPAQACLTVLRPELPMMPGGCSLQT